MYIREFTEHTIYPKCSKLVIKAKHPRYYRPFHFPGHILFNTANYISFHEKDEIKASPQNDRDLLLSSKCASQGHRDFFYRLIFTYKHVTSEQSILQHSTYTSIS